MSNKYKEYQSKMREIADINHAAAVLGWDQEVNLPEKANQIRSQQLATVAGIAHEKFTSDEMGVLLEDLKEDENLDAKEKRNIKLTKKSYDRNTKLPKSFVQEMSGAISESYFAWHKAKDENNFAHYAPKLERLIEFKKKQISYLGVEDHPYDTLLDEYEPEAKTADLEVLFKEVKENLVPFVKQISEAEQVYDAFMFKHFDKDQQWKYSLDLLADIGYDFKAGRQDVSAHPFTTSFGSQDVRVTTRISEENLNEMIWSCIHEGGHALYEQGLPVEEYGLPSGSAISLGIHESQSRLWENNVGRSLPFWKAHYSKIQNAFPEQLKSVDAEGFYKAMNKVEPSLIRTAADELTYHFHVMIRFEIEKAIIEEKVKVKDLPELWNSKYKDYLNVDVPNDSEGVLQDIHWSHGSFGYFPTYSLGSFYAVQFYNQAKKEIPGLEGKIEAGDCSAMLNWLRENIHQYGQQYSADELCMKITGEKLNFKHFMDYAKDKYSGIYGL